tara:strand:- start:3091 stop:4455 length:1365 start_codon:yes stop_codon:yes gene_type:complete
MIIKFKNKKDIDFTKIFPVISEEDYSLLSDQELSISNEQVAKLNDNKFLNLAGYHISKELIIMSEMSFSSEQADVQRIVDEKYIFSEDVVDILFAGMESKKNVILWGRGGHGKSEITELVLKEMYDKGLITEEPFIQAFGDGLTEEKLFGGMDIKRYKAEGVIEYLPLNSFMNHEVVVFEEIFDAPASVLLSLKDIMTSKKFRQGSETFNIRTKIIIGLTNKSKKDFSDKNDSLKALAERFALTLKVEWDHYKKTNFLKLFNVVFGTEKYKEHSKKLSELANIIDINNADGASFVSPRTAVNAAELFMKGKKLEYISEIDQDTLIKYRKSQSQEKFSKMHEILLKNIDLYIDKYDLCTMDQDEDFLKELSDMEVEIGGEPIKMDFMSASNRPKKEQKILRAKFILSIINQITAQGAQMQQFTQTKSRLNEIIKIAKEELEADKDKKEPTETTAI